MKNQPGPDGVGFPFRREVNLACPPLDEATPVTEEYKEGDNKFAVAD